MVIVVYVDGIFDLFHIGHLKIFQYIKNNYTNCKLYVGVINDKVAENYKRKPIINEFQRCEIVKSIRYVDKIIFPAPLILNNTFLQKNNINLVVHSFFSNKDKQNQSDFYKDISENFEEIPYTKEISTTDIINTIRDRGHSFKL